MQLAEVVRECWASGLADVRTLREGRTFFEDTAIYLLKEDSHKGKGARRYSTSRNLTPPAEPVRLRLGEEEEAEVPPGVKIIEHVQNANEFGRYEVMVGRIYNQAAFGAWWQIQRRKAAPDPWERLRRRRQRKSLRYRRPGPPDSLVGGLTIPLRFIGEVRTNEYRL